MPDCERLRHQPWSARTAPDRSYGSAARSTQVFRDPAEIVAARDLSRAEKLRLLAHWEACLLELMNGCGSEASFDRPGHVGFMRDRVTRGLEALGARRA